MGSQSDWETLRHAAEMLERLAVPHETRIVSAHRTPDRLREYATGARERGLQVIIAGAGGAAHLPGMCAAWTPLPVLGVPVECTALKGMDSLLSIVQMPAGVPVGTLAIGRAGAVNAALLAAAILARARMRRAGRTAGRADAAGGRPPAGDARAPSPLRGRGGVRPYPSRERGRVVVTSRCRRTPPSAWSAAASWAGCRRWRLRGWAIAAIS